MTNITEPALPGIAGTTGRLKRPLVLASIMLATFMVAIEATIIATAMPRIVGQLGGFSFYTWVFSAYLLAQCTMTLIFGKLSDIFGRKPIMNAGIMIFLLGSLLAGFAGSMPWLIGFRVIQGLGAGAIQPMTITMIGDLYAPAERARVQGIVASVWTAAAVLGPPAGGLIVDHLSWGWVFWVNLPVGALTIAGFALFLREEIQHRAARIDWPGAVLFAVSIVCFLFILTATDLDPWWLIALAATFLVSAVLFVVQELRAPEPMISIALWRSRLVATSNAASFLAGMVLVGLTTVLPLYLQGVMSRSPFVSGFALTTLIVGWTLALTGASYCFKTLGVRTTLRLGSPAFPVGAAILLFLTPESSPVLASAGSFVMGIGMGLVSTTSIILVQESVERSMRGSATASIIFCRSLGNALGATVIGALFTLGITHFSHGAQGDDLHRLLNEPGGLSNLARDLNLRSVLDAALHWSLGGILVVAALTLAASWLLPVAPNAARQTT